jgi:release factor glutamine methyltransferase
MSTSFRYVPVEKGGKMKFGELLKIGQSLLSKNSIDIKEARLILAFVLSVDLEKLIIISNDAEMEDATVGKYLALIERRVNGVPYAYLTHNKEFMGLNFYVDENVLIPRPDTEILVESVIKLNKKKILDMCTGSGCIAISLAKLINGSKVTAVDISSEALIIAEKNSELNNVKVEFIKSNLFEKINDKYDIIVSNPPYIQTGIINTLENEVKKEPFISLDGGEDGLFFYREIIGKARNYLIPNGYLALEIGYDQRDTVRKILEENSYEVIDTIKDIGGNDRVIISTI